MLEQPVDGVPVKEAIAKFAACFRKQATGMTGCEVECVASLPLALATDRIRAAPSR
jgi:hypothetical protein